MLIMRISREGDNKRSFIFLKKILITLLLVGSVLGPVTAFAYEPIIDSENLESEEKPSLVEKHLSKFVLNVSNSLIAMMQAQDVSVLVFQREEIVKSSDATFENKANASRESLEFGIFPKALFDGVAQIYDMFAKLTPVPIIVLFVLGALLLLLDMFRNADTISKAKEQILGVIFAILLIRFGHIAWEWIIAINFWIVDAVYLALKAGGITVTTFLSTVWDPSSTEDVMRSPSFTTALLVIFALFMTFLMNYQYMMRLITLAILIALFPIVIISAVIPSRRSVLNIWFSAFTSQIFIQTGHAIALGLFFFALKNAGELNFWLVFVMFFALPTMTDVVQRIVDGFTGNGNGGGIGTSIKNGSGMSGLMAVTAISRGVFQKGKGSVTSGGELENQGIQGGTVAPVGLKNAGVAEGSSPVTNGVMNSSMSNEGVGSAPITSGLSQNTRPRGAAKVWNAVANKGKKIASSSELGTVGKLAAVGGMAAIGSMASTMVTGNGTKGAMIGGGVGLAGAKVGGAIKQTGGKGVQVLGEGFQSKQQGNDFMHLTNQRLGYYDSSQLSDPKEMKRMGEELIGGSLGKTMGSVAGNANYFKNRETQHAYEPSQQAYETVNTKHDLDWGISQKEQEVGILKANQVNAKKDLDYAVATYGNDHSVTSAAQSNYQQSNLAYLQGDKELRDMKQQQATFYQNTNQNRNSNTSSPNNTRMDGTTPIPNTRATGTNANANTNVSSNPSQVSQRNQAEQRAQQRNRQANHANAVRQHADQTRALQNRVRSNGQP